MILRTISNILIIFTIATFVGCSSNTTETYDYQPMDSVSFSVKTENLVNNPDIGSLFLYYELSITNQSNKSIYLDIGQIRASLNGVVSLATYYDSLASVMPEKEKLIIGESRYKLYFVFPAYSGIDNIEEFRVINHGLSTK